MLPGASLRFELLVRLSRTAISIVDRLRSALTRREGTNTAGLPETGQPFHLLSGPHRLEAWKVSPSQAPRAALLILPGIGDRMAYWRPVQSMLARNGIASLIFHYSGYLKSEGRTTPQAMERDAHAAYAALRETIPSATPIFVLGFSLGSGVVAEVALHLTPPPAGIVLCQPYTSFREAARRVARPAPWLAGLVPDIWNSYASLRRLPVPLLIVHAEGDTLFPASMAHALADEARRSGQPVTLALIPGYPHNAIYLSVPDDYWAPILHFMLTPPLSADCLQA